LVVTYVWVFAQVSNLPFVVTLTQYSPSVDELHDHPIFPNVSYSQFPLFDELFFGTQQPFFKSYSLSQVLQGFWVTPLHVISLNSLKLQQCVIGLQLLTFPPYFVLVNVYILLSGVPYYTSFEIPAWSA